MALFLGMSIISIAEVFELFFLIGITIFKSLLCLKKTNKIANNKNKSSEFIMTEEEKNENRI